MGSGLWNFWQYQTFPEIFNTVNLIMLIITSGCLFPKWSLSMFFHFDKKGAPLLKCPEGEDTMLECAILDLHESFLWFDPPLNFAEYSLSGQRRKRTQKISSINFVALHLWPDLANMQCIVKVGVGQNANSSIYGFASIWQVLKNLCDLISILRGLYPALTGSWPEYSLHWDDILM